MEINKQPTEKPNPDLSHLDFHSAWRTIQGEGPFAGRPAVFVRLSGCNLQCPLCDTDYTSKRERLHYQEVVERVKRLAFSNETVIGLVVITGGEPFRQQLSPLCNALFQVGLTPQIETNGTLAPPELSGLPDMEIINLTRFARIVCSPKTAKIHPAIEQHAAAFKYVLQAGHVDSGDGLPTSVLGFKCKVARPPGFVESSLIFVQPLDEQDPEANKRNLEAAAVSSMRYGYTLSVQMHKLAGLQ